MGALIENFMISSLQALAHIMMQRCINFPCQQGIHSEGLFWGTLPTHFQNSVSPLMMKMGPMTTTDASLKAFSGKGGNDRMHIWKTETPLSNYQVHHA